jgi:opacity protein-like surface antigen
MRHTKEGLMKRHRLLVIAMIAVSLLAFPWSAAGQVDVRVNPIDRYISVFGGVALPSKTDVTEVSPGTNLTIFDVKLDNSPSIGGKIGMYITKFRAGRGLDFGLELDITNYSPDQKGNQVLRGTLNGVPVGVITTAININSTLIAVNLLARKPFGVTQDFPNGRWSPYVGIGGGVQTSTFEPPGTIKKGRQPDPAFQALAGVKAFLTQHVALFGEYKFTHASHTFETQIGAAIITDKFTFNVNHLVAGIAVHF